MHPFKFGPIQYVSGTVPRFKPIDRWMKQSFHMVMKPFALSTQPFLKRSGAYAPVASAEKVQEAQMNIPFIAPTAVRTLKSWWSRCVLRLLWRVWPCHSATRARRSAHAERIITAGKPVVGDQLGRRRRPLSL